MDGAGIEAFVEDQRAVDQRLHQRHLRDRRGIALGHPDQRTPGNGCPVQRRHVLGPGTCQGRTAILVQLLADTRMRHFQAAQTVVAGTHVQQAGAAELGPGLRDILVFQLLAVHLDVGISVLGVAPRRGGEQRGVTRLLLQQAVHQLEAERRGGTDQLGIVVRGEAARPTAPARWRPGSRHSCGPSSRTRARPRRARTAGIVSLWMEGTFMGDARLVAPHTLFGAWPDSLDS